MKNNVFPETPDAENDNDAVETRKSTAETLPAVSSDKPDIKPSK